MERDMEPEEPIEDAVNRKSLYLFGRNVAEVPCYRDSLLNGIYGGFAGGLLYFLFTSNTRAATNAAVGAFSITTFGYWIHCRYNYTKLKFEMAQISAGIRNKAMYEGTVVEKEIEKKMGDLDIKQA